MKSWLDPEPAESAQGGGLVGGTGGVPREQKIEQGSRPYLAS